MKWTALLTQLLTLLNSFVRLLQTRQKEQEVEKLEENPGEWFDDHFNGLSNNADQPNETKTTVTPDS